jgi:3',5'-cyclic AMP phosphodiesterase CpdA
MMKPWSFLHVTDIHVGSPRSFRYAPAWNENWQTARQQMIDINPDLLLVGGDVARDGLIHKFELESIKQDMQELPFPHFVIPGNMDIGNKKTEIKGPNRDDISLNVKMEAIKQFEDVYGALWWSFEHRDVRFSGFCDLLINSGLPLERDLWTWLDEQTALPPVQHHVWLMHYALFVDSPEEPNFNISSKDTYNDWYFGIDDPGRSQLYEVFKKTHTDIVLSGHIHCRKAHQIDGIRFYKGPATSFPQWPDRWPDGDSTLGFQRFDVTENGIDYTFVPLTQISQKTGYGPGGHPPPEERDYGLAWEK